MNGRDEILARIAEALQVKSDASLRPSAPPPAFRDAMPPGGTTTEDRIARFAAHAEALRAEFVVMRDGSELKRIAEREGWKRVASHTGLLTKPAIAALGLPCLWTDNGCAPDDLEQCDAGITECEALVAQTGSVLVSSVRSGGRGLSVLPPHHVVLATVDQLVPDLTAALDLIRTRYGGTPPSFVSFVTGPSRTGDIERILVLGAHGPAKLTILLRTAQV